MAIAAYCFMPDHVHALIESLSLDSSFLKFVSMFKQRSAFRHRQQFEAPLWQDSFYDHVLRGDEDSRAVIAYILRNPVVAGLCDDPRAYPFSGSDRYSIEELLKAAEWRP